MRQFMNTNTEVSLYDFLNCEIIGVLLLFICGFTPDNMMYKWSFFVYAFIAGLVFSKLAENAFWTRWTRNPVWAIKKGIEAVNRDIELIDEKKIIIDDYMNSMSNYIRDYYQVTKGSNYKIIQILEAQYKFVTNLALLSIVCLFIGVINPTKLNCFVQIELFINPIEKEKMLIYVYVVLFFCVCVGLLMNSCMPKVDIQIEEDCKNCFIGMFWIVIVVLLLLFVSFEKYTLCNISLFLILIFSFLARKIQIKISTLVIEGAYYLKKLEKEGYGQPCEKEKSKNSNS